MAPDFDILNPLHRIIRVRGEDNVAKRVILTDSFKELWLAEEHDLDWRASNNELNEEEDEVVLDNSSLSWERRLSKAEESYHIILLDNG